MQPLEQYIEEGYKVFAVYGRPVQFVDHQGDPEYREYEVSLQGVTRETLTMGHIGHIGWGPLNALRPEAMSYFMPRLIEFAVCGVNDRAGQPFMERFISTVGEAPSNERFVLFGHEQREFVYRTFLLLKGLYFNRLKESCYDEDLDRAIERWRI